MDSESIGSSCKLKSSLVESSEVVIGQVCDLLRWTCKSNPILITLIEPTK